MKSIEEHGSLRNVKALLLKGSLRTLFDYERKRPIDYVEMVSDPLLANDLVQILAQPRSWLCCLFKTPLEKLEKSKKILIQFYFLLAVEYITMFLFVFQYVTSALFFTHTFFLLWLGILMFILAKKDPGYVYKDESLNFLSLLETGNLDKV